MTPWRPRPRESVEVETVSMTRVSVTRSRRVEGERPASPWERADKPGRESESRGPDRSEWRGEAAEGYLDVASKVVADKVEASKADFVHQAMTPLPTEGFLGLWAGRSVSSEPPRRHAAAAFKAYDRFS